MEYIKSYDDDFSCISISDDDDSRVLFETVIAKESEHIASTVECDISNLENEFASVDQEEQSSHDIKEKLLKTLVTELTNQISTLNEEVGFLRNDINSKNDMIRYLQTHDRDNSVTIFTEDSNKESFKKIKEDISYLNKENKHLNNMVLFLLKQFNGTGSRTPSLKESETTYEADSSIYLRRLMALRDETLKIDDKHVTKRRKMKNCVSSDNTNEQQNNKDNIDCVFEEASGRSKDEEKEKVFGTSYVSESEAQKG